MVRDAEVYSIRHEAASTGEHRLVALDEGRNIILQTGWTSYRQPALLQVGYRYFIVFTEYWEGRSFIRPNIVAELEWQSPSAVGFGEPPRPDPVRSPGEGKERRMGKAKKGGRI